MKLKSIRIEAYPDADCNHEDMIGWIDLTCKKRLNHIDLMIDETTLGTINSNTTDVMSYIKEFKNLVYAYNGEIHKPNTLKIMFDGISMVRILKRLTIKYSSFEQDGKPASAIVSIDLAGVI